MALGCHSWIYLSELSSCLPSIRQSYLLLLWDGGDQGASSYVHKGLVDLQITVTCKGEHFFETVKCTDFWKSLQLSFWILGLDTTRRQSKSLDWISAMSLCGNCYYHSLLLLFCAYLFIYHPGISEWFTIMCCLAVNPRDKEPLFLILNPTLSKFGLCVQQVSSPVSAPGSRDCSLASI